MRAHPALLVPLAVALAAPAARPQGPPVFGASADLVVIDLIATDGDGRLVADLRPEEIEVYEDGSRQRLEMLRLVTAGAPAEAPETSGEPGAHRAIGSGRHRAASDTPGGARAWSWSWTSKRCRSTRSPGRARRWCRCCAASSTPARA